MGGGKQARVSWSILTQDYVNGGFCAPDFYIYYLCAQAQYAYYWYRPHAFTPYVAVEDGDAHPIPMAGMITRRGTPKSEINTLDTTIAAWQAIGTLANKLHIYALAMPLAFHAALSVTQEAGPTRLLREAGFERMQDLYPNGSFITQEELTYITNQTSLSIHIPPSETCAEETLHVVSC